MKQNPKKNKINKIPSSWMKYSEDKILKEIEDYVNATYKQHYSNQKGMQALDVIDSISDVGSYCLCNAVKYLFRYGKKEGKNKKDILKTIHYLILLMHFESQKEN